VSEFPQRLTLPRYVVKITPMSPRNFSKVLGILFSCLVFCLPGRAQNPRYDEAMQSIRDAQAAYEREQRARDQTISAVDNSLRQQAITEATIARQRNAFRLSETFQQLYRAAEQLGRALLAKGVLKEPASNVEKHTKVLLDFVKGINKEKVRFDPGELKGFPDSELGLQALATAERIAPAMAGAILSEREQKWDVQWLQALPNLERELLRLQWMSRRLRR
jgi:hypothetical protein